ncbi:MAG: 23S rRNA (uracil(1939)-C(5))-methyltransferase RlmD [Lachnospiraceae bacterium]|nr:23S rRNA (uracil(1939)-C(5))-methyltransferase RlmD [Lachnospiraceae bacterium]
MKKNEIIKIEVDRLSSEGQGIGFVDGQVVFVKNALPGEIVNALILKVNKKEAYAVTREVLVASENRVKPSCPAYFKCGGCDLLHQSFEAENRFKRDKVKDCLSRIGGFKDVEVEETVFANELHYRNKGQYPVGLDKEGNIVAGFYAPHSHRIVEAPCILQKSVNDVIVKAVLAHMRKNHIRPYADSNGEVLSGGLVRHIYIRVGESSREIMVCLVINGNDYPKKNELVNELVAAIEGFDQRLTLTSFVLNINKEVTNVILGKKNVYVYGKEYITDKIGDLKYRISPHSFYQVNPKATKKLYDIAVENAALTGNETVFDLYCGIGSISLYLAKKAKKVYGVEIVPEAINDARLNAKENGIKNAEFFVGAAEDVVDDKFGIKQKGDKVDVVVLDPPRKGCDGKLIESVLKIAPERVVYVSCDPATLARDLKLFCEEKYEIKRVTPVNMFPRTEHVETVCLLSNRKADAKIRINVDLEDYYAETGVYFGKISTRRKNEK